MEANLRDLLFGDLPLAQWATGTEEPFASFARAVTRFAQGDIAGAARVLRSILQRPDLESRHRLEAWFGLRQAGEVPPPAEAKQLLGVVVEVPVGDGYDTLAAYDDGRARYLNHAGSVFIGEIPQGSLTTHVRKLLTAGQVLALRIGPHQGARPPIPSGLARISLLTPSGLHFGQGPFEALGRDPLAAPVVAAAIELLNAIVELTTSPRRD